MALKNYAMIFICTNQYVNLYAIHARVSAAKSCRIMRVKIIGESMLAIGILFIMLSFMFHIYNEGSMASIGVAVVGILFLGLGLWFIWLPRWEEIISRQKR